MNPIEDAKYVEQILKDFDLLDAPDAIQMRFISKLGENIFKRIILEISDTLPEDAYAEFEQLTQSGDQKAMLAFLESKIPQFAERMQTVARAEVEETKALIKKAREEGEK